MNVRVDQSRHHGLTAAVDPTGILDRDRLSGDFSDTVILHQHVTGLGEVIVDAVEKPPVLENRHGHVSRPGDVASGMVRARRTANSRLPSFRRVGPCLPPTSYLRVASTSMDRAIEDTAV